MRSHADDVLLFLEVVRHGSYSAAAAALGINHTTVARRISALEATVGGPLLSRARGRWEPTELGHSYVAAAEAIERTLVDVESGTRPEHRLTGLVRALVPDAFGATVMSEVAGDLARRAPGISLELVLLTRPIRPSASGEDFRVVVGRPTVPRHESIPIARYSLGMYASAAYLAEHRIDAPADLDDHPLIYYVDSLQDVSALDFTSVGRSQMRRSVSATSSLIHVQATLRGAGIGLLPCFIADHEAGLVRLFPDAYDLPAQYWVVARKEALRRPVVAAVLRSMATAVERSVPGLTPLQWQDLPDAEKDTTAEPRSSAGPRPPAEPRPAVRKEPH